MFEFQGIWLPDGEKHFPEWMAKHGELVNGKGTYQIKKLRAALGFCKHFRTAVDIGAHVGMWSMHLAPRFQQLHAFEPVAQYRECYERNVAHRDHTYLYPCALGREEGRVRMQIDPSSSGGTFVGEVSGDRERKDGWVPAYTLDSFGLADVDFVKIDCEGFEHHVVAGAEETLRRCQPTIIVEQKSHKLAGNFGIANRPALEMLVSFGAKVRKEMGGDFILNWD